MDSLSPTMSVGSFSVVTPRACSLDVELYHDQQSFITDVQSLHANHFDRMVFVFGKNGSPVPLELVLSEFASASKALLVVDPVSTDVVWVSSAVLVLRTARDAYEAYHKAQSKASLLTVQAFVKTTGKGKYQGTNNDIDVARFLQLDCTFPLADKSTGVCAVMSLAEAKRIMPADEEVCRSRVILVKRANALGDGVSMKLKAYFESILGENCVEQVLMLPLKSRSVMNSRPKPSKTGFIVFKNASEARMARAMGSEQMPTPNAVIKVETFDGL